MVKLKILIILLKNNKSDTSQKKCRYTFRENSRSKHNIAQMYLPTDDFTWWTNWLQYEFICVSKIINQTISIQKFNTN